MIRPNKGKVVMQKNVLRFSMRGKAWDFGSVVELSRNAPKIMAQFVQRNLCHGCNRFFSER